jgi:hypothetical protein
VRTELLWEILNKDLETEGDSFSDDISWLSDGAIREVEARITKWSEEIKYELDRRSEARVKTYGPQARYREVERG